MTVDVVATQLLAVVAAAGCVVYGILGLIGRDLYLPTRAGYGTPISGRPARIVGGILLVLGLFWLLEMGAVI